MDDISKLVDETFCHADTNSFHPFLFDEEIEVSKLEDVPSETSGVFYHIQKSLGTFVVRMVPCEDLSVTYKQILASPDEFPKLRLLDEDGNTDFTVLKYFETDNIELAHSLCKEMSHNRYPLYEEDVINISDPGYSWWLELKKNQIKIYFKLSRTADLDKMYKLGPLGDPKLSLKRFSLLNGYFKALFPVASYAGAHGALDIVVEYENHLFKYFKNLLLTGNVDFEFWQELREYEIHAKDSPYVQSIVKANYFIMELANMRRFWQTIQDDLNG
jgi:hypothetical protein